MNSTATIEPRETSAEAKSGAAVGLHAVVTASDRKRERNRLWMARWRKNNPELARQRGLEWDAKHPGENAKQLREYYQRHKERHKKKVVKWQKRNRKAVRGYTRKCMNRHTAELSDYYVRSKLSRGTILKRADWPVSLVKLKRAELKLKRLWPPKPRASKTSTN